MTPPPTAPSIPPSDFFHILNSSAHHREEVSAYFSSRPRSSYAWVERTSHPTHLETVVEWAIRENHPTVAIWGGDGTFSRVVQAIYDLNAFDKVRLAFVPAGTCNDFVRALRDRSSVAGNRPPAEEGAFSGLVDVGLVRSGDQKRIFLNNAGFGRSAESTLKKRAHPMHDIFQLKPHRIHFYSPQRAVVDALMGMVCNAPYFGGGLFFARDVQPDDGIVNAFFVRDVSRWRLAGRFILARLFRAALPTATRVDAPQLELESDRDLFIQVDGERAFPIAVRRVEFSVLKKKLALVQWRR